MSKKFKVTNLSPRYTAEGYAETMNYKSAFNKNKGKKKCVVCDSFLCSCQVNLLDWVVVRVPLKDANPVSNCPHNCVNHGVCINCYNFDKFKMVVRL